MKLLEMGAEGDRARFPAQPVPPYGRQKQRRRRGRRAKGSVWGHPKAKGWLWGGEVWSGGCFAGVAGAYGSEEAASNRVKSQGMEKKRKQIDKMRLELF
jgi:hypothetical protein